MSVFTALNNIKSKGNLTLHHMVKFFLIFLVNLPGWNLKCGELHFFVSLYHLKVLEWTSDFRAIDDLQRAHWDETDFSPVYEHHIPQIISQSLEYINWFHFGLLFSTFTHWDETANVRTSIVLRRSSLSVLHCLPVRMPMVLVLLYRQDIKYFYHCAGAKARQLNHEIMALSRDYGSFRPP